MSYDIYGNPLRRGHCEVHPHVHEEYPCSVCIQENKNRNSQQQSECDYYKIASLEHGLELSQQRIAELEQRNDELAATVERLKAQQSEVAARAVAEACNQSYSVIANVEREGVVNSREGVYCDVWLSSSDLMRYANQLREQGNE